MADAKATWPMVQEQRKNDGRSVGDWTGEAAFDRYMDERRREEKEMWFFVGRKWVQDLKTARVLVAEEDGLGLLG